MKAKVANKAELSVAEQFKSDFAKRFGGRRIAKTAFHFFNWAYAYKNPNQRDEMLTRFKAYCERTCTKATWQNAVEWFNTGTVGGFRK